MQLLWLEFCRMLFLVGKCRWGTKVLASINPKLLLLFLP